MAKLITFFFILLAIQAALIVYADQEPQSTDIWTFVTNLDNWNSLTFVLGLVGIAGAIGLTGIIAGSLFGYKTDFLVFAGAIAGFISMGVILTNLGNVIRDELIGHVFTSCAPGDCAIVTFIIAITLAPIALYYVWTVIEWWRGKDY